MSNIKKVTSALTSPAGVTLYCENGEIVFLSSKDYRTAEIVRDVYSRLSANEPVTLNTEDYNATQAIETKTGGVVKFLKKKWRDFMALFGNEVPDNVNPDADTTVAVVNGKEIPGVEKLDRYLNDAAWRNAKGFQRFMERVSAVIDRRGHTVNELLAFLERGDLPIADDGSIVAYKMLYRKQDSEYMIDPHTRRVEQRLGSFVMMDESLVDPNRRLQCSTGLHVARRAYIANFHGDTICLIKVAPEDVIAVPLNEPDKMRVKGYHIVGVLPEEGAALVRSNKPMTLHRESAQMLADVIAGRHVGIIEYVNIKGELGTNIEVTTVKPMTAKTVGAELKPLPELKPLTEHIATAAETGDLSAALDTRHEPEVVEALDHYAVQGNRIVEIARASVKKNAAAPATPVRQERSFDHIPEKWREAYKAVVTGAMSQRQAEKHFKVCAKKLRALMREHGDLTS